MTQLVASGFASSSSTHCELISHPICVQAKLAALNEPPLFDDIWEPPTPAEWRRAVRTLALQAVRQMLHSRLDCRLARALEKPLSWR